MPTGRNEHLEQRDGELSASPDALVPSRELQGQLDAVAQDTASVLDEQTVELNDFISVLREKRASNDLDVDWGLLEGKLEANPEKLEALTKIQKMKGGLILTEVLGDTFLFDEIGDVFLRDVSYVKARELVAAIGGGAHLMTTDRFMILGEKGMLKGGTYYHPIISWLEGGPQSSSVMKPIGMNYLSHGNYRARLSEESRGGINHVPTHSFRCSIEL